MTSPSEGSLLGQVHTAVIRLDAKVDNVQRELGEMRDGRADHETRLRLLETRPYVSPATVWKLLSAVLAAAGVVVAVINTVK